MKVDIKSTKRLGPIATSISASRKIPRLNSPQHYTRRGINSSKNTNENYHVGMKLALFRYNLKI